MDFFEQLRRHLSPADFARMQEWMASLDEATRAEMLEFILARESNAPGVGEAAPDFDLPLLGHEPRRVRLSTFRGERPVALIFGSFT